MYGLLLENLSEYIKAIYGDEKWDEIRRQAGISSTSFSVHEDYEEDLLNKLSKIAQDVSIFEFIIANIVNTYSSGDISVFGWN